MMPAPAIPIQRLLSLPRRASVVQPQYALGFGLFILLNAALFLRPAEIMPGMVGLEIYLVIILVCFTVSFPAVLGQLTVRSLESRPVTVCVLGLLVAIPLSHLSHFYLAGAALGSFEFFKVVVYYLLFAGLVTTPDRLRRFLFWLVLFAAILALLAVLQYHDLIRLPTLKTLQALEKDQTTGREMIVRRLQATGPFHDPNDLCVLLVVGILLSLYWVTERQYGVVRFGWLGALGLFLYALALTQSRGGFLALLGGLVVFLRMRFGWLTTLLLGAFLLPLFFVVFAGRQTAISTTAGTGQERIQIWSDGLILFRKAPLFGVGLDKYEEFVGHVAHNSYLQAFTELGIFGGILFVGAFVCALGPLRRLGLKNRRILQPELSRLHPYLTGAAAGYAIGMLSLTLTCIVPTYMILAMAGSFTQMVSAHPPLGAERFDLRLLGRLVGIGLLVLAGIYLFVRVFFQH
jgi:hypothetical protein